jgi:hypothetical protein
MAYRESGLYTTQFSPCLPENGHTDIASLFACQDFPADCWAQTWNLLSGARHRLACQPHQEQSNDLRSVINFVLTAGVAVIQHLEDTGAHNKIQPLENKVWVAIWNEFIRNDLVNRPFLQNLIALFFSTLYVFSDRQGHDAKTVFSQGRSIPQKRGHGLNSSGKSSIIQALRLLHKLKPLPDYGPLMDLVSVHAQEFFLEACGQTKCFSAFYNQSQGLQAKGEFDLMPGLFSFISAARLGPEPSLPLSLDEDLVTVGEKGEFVLDFLARYEELKGLPEILRHEIAGAVPCDSMSGHG